MEKNLPLRFLNIRSIARKNIGRVDTGGSNHAGNEGDDAGGGIAIPIITENEKNKEELPPPVENLHHIPFAIPEPTPIIIEEVLVPLLGEFPIVEEVKEEKIADNPVLVEEEKVEDIEDIDIFEDNTPLGDKKIDALKKKKGKKVATLVPEKDGKREKDPETAIYEIKKEPNAIKKVIAKSKILAKTGGLDNRLISITIPLVLLILTFLFVEISLRRKMKLNQ